MSSNRYLLPIGFIVIVCIILTGYAKKCAFDVNNPNIENYKDPLWMQPPKLYRDYYTRANGSIYGTPRTGWNMFSGLNSNERAY